MVIWGAVAGAGVVAAAVVVKGLLEVSVGLSELAISAGGTVPVKRVVVEGVVVLLEWAGGGLESADS